MRGDEAVIVGLVLLALGACSGDDDSKDATGGSHADAQGGDGQSSADAGSPGGGHSSASAGTMSSAAGSSANAGSSSSAGASGTSNAGSSGSRSSSASPSFDDAMTMIDDYATAHPGQDGDVTAKTPAEVASDPGAQKILALCGEDQRPVIPKLVWEYGGGDHAWVNPEMSALIYCVYIPASPDSDHWQYDADADHVTADVYLPYPDDNPCKAEAGADQVAKCIGDASNFEILVDTASLNDGHDVGLELSEASTELKLILPDHSRIHLFDGT